jgi:ABC-type multidrug transport system fused ATPase/permease subunit
MPTLLLYTRLKNAWVTPYFLRQWKLMCALTLFLLLTVGFQLGTPLLLRSFLDAVSQQAVMDTVLRFATLYIVAAFALRGLRVGENYLAEWVAWKATNALRIDLVRRCLSLDLSFHLVHTPGELIERIDGDVGVLNNFFSRFVLVLVTNALIVLGVIGILATIDWRISLLLACYSVLYVVAIFWLNTKTVANYVRALQAEADLFGFLEERLSGTEDIRTNGATGYVLRLLTVLMRKRLYKQQHAEVMQGLISILRMLLYVVGLLTGLGFSAILYRQGQITIGTAYIIFNYMYIVWGPLRDLVYQFSDFQKALASLQRLSALFAANSEIVDGTRQTLPAGPLAVRFEQVSFSYGGLYVDTGAEEIRALHKVSFRLEPGRILGILGQTGSGKSTLTRLLFRFYDPQRGQIYLNDVDIQEVTVQALRSRVGLVTQDVQLFYASLRDNITFLDRTISDVAILEAFQVLGLGEWYARLPDGLETHFHAGSLSAGQAQLIALTRAFLQKPDLVILDEASSRLDPFTEALVQHALNQLLQGRTAIIIAHRLQTVSKVDDILVLHDGEVSEIGTRQQLGGQDTSRYARLLEIDSLYATQP